MPNETATLRRPETPYHPKVITDHVRGQHIIGRSSGHHATRVQNDDVVCVCGGQVEIVDDGYRRQPKTSHSLQQVDLVTQIQVVGGLIEHEDLRLLSQGTRQLHPLLLAT